MSKLLRPRVGAIAAGRMVIATNKTQNNNMERSPDEVSKHYDLAKVATLAELLRLTTKS